MVNGLNSTVPTNGGYATNRGPLSDTNQIIVEEVFDPPSLPMDERGDRAVNREIADTNPIIVEEVTEPPCMTLAADDLSLQIENIEL